MENFNLIFLGFIAALSINPVTSFILKSTLVSDRYNSNFLQLGLMILRGLLTVVASLTILYAPLFFFENVPFSQRFRIYALGVFLGAIVYLFLKKRRKQV